MSFFEKYRYELFFCALLLQIVYPFFALLFAIPQPLLNLISFTLLVMASFVMAQRKIPKALIIIFGIFGVSGSWCNYFAHDEFLVSIFRIYAINFLYFTLIYVLTRSFIESKVISLQVVIGAMSGYLLIGFLGASTMEMMDFHHPGSFRMDSPTHFDYYYFSFISLVTVGYGDIVPHSSSAKSLTILVSVVGQLYMAIGIASFVGKFMNR